MVGKLHCFDYRCQRLKIRNAGAKSALKNALNTGRPEIIV